MRYQRKKSSTKSGDSGEENIDDDDEDKGNDELNRSKEFSLDDYPFLSPTSAKFPRKTTTIGGTSSTQTRKSTEFQAVHDDYTHDDDSWEDYINSRTESISPSSSVYSYVSYYNRSDVFCFVLVFKILLKLIKFCHLHRQVKEKLKRKTTPSRSPYYKCLVL